MLKYGLTLAALLASGSAQAQLSRNPGGIDMRTAAGVTRVDAIADGVLRVRVARGGTFDEDASWAVAADMRKRRAAVTETPDGFRTALLSVAVDAAGMVTVRDPAGKLVTADARAVTLDGRDFTLAKRIGPDEAVYGLGDKTGRLNRRGGSFVDWNTDRGIDVALDPAYKSIPFLISTGQEGGAYGLFLDNTWRARFDVGQSDAGELRIGAPDGPIDYYVIAGPTVADVTRRYADLTGHAPLSPRWALGYQQARYSYMSQAEVGQIADRLASDRIPTDVIWLDIDFQDRNRPFTVNTTTFPDFTGMVRGLKARGIRTVTITDLHVARAEDGYKPYASGKAGDHFVRLANGEEFVGPVWPGPSVFPEFTAAKSRAWWGALYKEFVDAGVAGFWNDMNEPSVFVPIKTMPPEARHRIVSDDFAPRTATHAEIHNVFGQLNTRATFEGLTKLRPDERPFVMTRATYAGGQRYAATWTGDNSSSWEQLKLAIHQTLNLGLSGFGYTANDIGGFSGGASPELLTRWYQIGAWMPVFRNHAANTAPRSEPWVDGPEHLALRRAAIQERYRLMPYLYAVAEQNARTGDPIARPVFYDHPAITRSGCDGSMTFTLGRDLLVAPAPTPESPRAYDVCLPSHGWYDYWTGLPAVDKPKPVVKPGDFFPPPDDIRTVETPTLARLPVFVRPGAIVPKQALVANTMQVPEGPMELHVYPGPDCSGTLYADDGTTLGYTRGAFLRQAVRCEAGADGVTVTLDAAQGRYRPWWRAIAVVVHGWTGAATATRGRAALAATTDAQAQTATVRMPYRAGATAVRFARR